MKLMSRANRLKRFIKAYFKDIYWALIGKTNQQSQMTLGDLSLAKPFRREKSVLNKSSLSSTPLRVAPKKSECKNKLTIKTPLKGCQSKIKLPGTEKLDPPPEANPFGRVKKCQSMPKISLNEDATKALRKTERLEKKRRWKLEQEVRRERTRIEEEKQKLESFAESLVSKFDHCFKEQKKLSDQQIEMMMNLEDKENLVGKYQNPKAPVAPKKIDLPPPSTANEKKVKTSYENDEIIELMKNVPEDEQKDKVVKTRIGKELFYYDEEFLKKARKKEQDRNHERRANTLYHYYFVSTDGKRGRGRFFYYSVFHKPTDLLKHLKEKTWYEPWEDYYLEGPFPNDPSADVEDVMNDAKINSFQKAQSRAYLKAQASIDKAITEYREEGRYWYLYAFFKKSGPWNVSYLESSFAANFDLSHERLLRYAEENKCADFDCIRRIPIKTEGEDAIYLPEDFIGLSQKTSLSA